MLVGIMVQRKIAIIIANIMSAVNLGMPLVTLTTPDTLKTSLSILMSQHNHLIIFSKGMILPRIACGIRLGQHVSDLLIGRLPHSHIAEKLVPIKVRLQYLFAQELEPLTEPGTQSP